MGPREASAHAQSDEVFLQEHFSDAVAGAVSDPNAWGDKTSVMFPQEHNAGFCTEISLSV
jgi:hypothetical protein